MVENTLSVGRISEGFVLDHIEAGKSMEIYKYLNLDKLDCCVAIIKNARSGKMGKKDIMKIECPIDFMDLDILGFIDHNITVNIIKDQKILFPMGSVGHRFILRCRPVSPYDHGFTRFKEFAAFGLSRILKPFFQKKHLWLVYEKYCVSAQDNGFFFFQYCMYHLPENRN